jgi:hypothetical protein
MDNNKESRDMIMGIYEGVNPLEDHEFKPWSNDMQNKVYAYLQELTGSNPGAAYQAITPSKPKENIPVAGTTVNHVVKETTSIETASKEAAKGNDNEIEDWLKEFDIN